jgi:AAA ATPase domain
MPFKKTHQQGSLPSGPLFIGRANELLFFVQQILKPEEPTYNILSIWGQGGVGKTSLLQQFKNQTAMANFKPYCLTAWVDERQTTPASIMEKFALQLHLGSAFEKALHLYKEILQFLPPSRSPGSLQQTVVTKAPDLAGSLLEGIPIAGPPLREITKAATEHFLDHSQTPQERSGVPLNNPLDSLTQVFLTELNHLAEGKGARLSGQPKRGRRVLLFFDTFEQVADEVVPWLLYTVLEMEINPNIVFIIAGRAPRLGVQNSGFLTIRVR